MTGRRSSNKRSAAVAVGLSAVTGSCVFGAVVGTTLASWQDEESSATSFAAGTFETQSQGDGGEWAHHAAGSSASLGAEIADLAPGGNASAPSAGQSHYSSFRVRTSSDSSRSGKVRVSDLAVDGALARVLEFRVFDAGGDRSCAAAAAGPGTVFLVGGPQDYQQVSSDVTSGTGMTIGAFGSDPAELCLELRIAAPADSNSGDEAQGASAAAVLTVAVAQN
ncbi:SipW-dependent-type signal peptide-containing protein [Brevibacterium aurantiacum]|uniref:SipW-dependent-type signal peptide-containing protein n=1 Tax=Brevibacterium aurantiacum TaxID=273384 RepID=UPI0016434C54|nr:SipW-dependent-type signal peptide-containing protein [Brevibacterium aurantiacum]